MISPSHADSASPSIARMQRFLSSSISFDKFGYENEQTDFFDVEDFETMRDRLLLKSRGKYLSWNYGKMKLCYTVGANLKISTFISQTTDKPQPKSVLVSPAMT